MARSESKDDDMDVINDGIFTLQRLKLTDNSQLEKSVRNAYMRMFSNAYDRRLMPDALWSNRVSCDLQSEEKPSSAKTSTHTVTCADDPVIHVTNLQCARAAALCKVFARSNVAIQTATGVQSELDSLRIRIKDKEEQLACLVSTVKSLTETVLNTGLFVHATTGCCSVHNIDIETHNMKKVSDDINEMIVGSVISELRNELSTDEKDMQSQTLSLDLHDYHGAIAEFGKQQSNYLLNERKRLRQCIWEEANDITPCCFVDIQQDAVKMMNTRALEDEHLLTYNDIECDNAGYSKDFDAFQDLRTFDF
jgi:hypothetical protein